MLHGVPEIKALSIQKIENIFVFQQSVIKYFIPALKKIYRLWALFLLLFTSVIMKRI